MFPVAGPYYANPETRFFPVLIWNLLLWDLWSLVQYSSTVNFPIAQYVVDWVLKASIGRRQETHENCLWAFCKHASLDLYSYKKETCNLRISCLSLQWSFCGPYGSSPDERYIMSFRLGDQLCSLYLRVSFELAVRNSLVCRIHSLYHSHLGRLHWT